MSELAVAGEHGPGCGCVRCRGFEAGNAHSLTHGGYSILQNRRRASEIREQLVEQAPVVGPADAAMFDVAANLLAHGERGLVILESAQREELDAIERGEPLKPEQRQNLARLSADCRGWLNSAMRALDRLGCTPLARAQLGLDIAQGRRTLSLIELHAAAAAEEEAEG